MSTTPGNDTTEQKTDKVSLLQRISNAFTNLGTNATQTAKTGGQGTYRFSFLPPGRYKITVASAGFQDLARIVDVNIGQAATVDIQMALQTTSQSVEVSDNSAALIQVENADIATTFTARQIAELPNPGNDTTYIALTAPGVLANTGGGYGNFSTFGLPGTANLFTTNGQNNNDPYLSLNNSGATNLSLGKNEVEEASVINNGYSGQYGQLAGSQVNIVTKSGTNRFHGNGIWYWAGSALAG